MFAKLPLTALRAFESAARLKGFKAAADELSVTPAAVSHQIKILEQWVGTRLFERTAQGVLLSADGEKLFQKVHAGLQDIAESLGAFRPADAEASLTISTTPAFATLWLIPRLGSFHRLFANLHVQVETSNQLIDLARDSRVDVAIRGLSRSDPALFNQPLMHEHFSAYTTPDWQVPQGTAPLQLIGVPWTSDTIPPIDWPTWCAAAGHLDWLDRAQRRDYDDEHYALQAASAGHGLVLASNVLAADSVASGKLVVYRPDIQLPAVTYYAVCVPGRERLAPVRAFLDWMVDELD